MNYAGGTTLQGMIVSCKSQQQNFGKTYLSQSCCDLILFADVPRIKRHIVISLYNIENRDIVASLEELVHDMAA